MAKMKETAKTLFLAALAGMAGSMVKYLREHRGEPFDWRAFVSGMIVAAFVGVLAYGLCDALGFSQITSSAVVAMAGYCGGSLLDAMHKGIIESVQEFFKALIDRLRGQ